MYDLNLDPEKQRLYNIHCLYNNSEQLSEVENRKIKDHFSLDKPQILKQLTIIVRRCYDSATRR